MFSKQKGDAGHNLGFALDLIIRLDEAVTRSLSFNECLSIARDQVVCLHSSQGLLVLNSSLFFTLLRARRQ